MRPRPDRLERLPQQYFTALLAQVARHAALEGEPLVDLGRGNPEVGPPQHVIDALAEAANHPSAHGYPPFGGLPALREAIAARYSELYGVELDPHSEVTIVPGTKTAIVELALVLGARLRGRPARRRRRRLPQLPVQPLCGLRTRRDLRGRRRLRAGDRPRGRPRLRLRRHRLRRARAAVVPRRARRARGRRGDVLDVEDLRDGRLAARLRRRQRGDRLAPR